MGALALTLTLAGHCLPASAGWKRGRDVTWGTARVLERGELNFGVFAPIAWGARDWLTVQTHPVFDLLLELNFAARARLLDNRAGALSVTLGYKQGFLSEDDAWAPGEHVGDVQAGVTGSLYAGDRFVLTGTALWAPKIHRGETPSDYGLANGLAAVATVHFLAGGRDLFVATGKLRYSLVGREADTPIGTFAWVHDVERFESMHVVLGLSVGEFGLRSLTGDATGGATTVRLWPVVDLWWRL